RASDGRPGAAGSARTRGGMAHRGASERCPGAPDSPQADARPLVDHAAGRRPGRNERTGRLRKVVQRDRFSNSGGVPNRIRTRVLALKGPRPGPLDDGDLGRTPNKNLTTEAAIVARSTSLGPSQAKSSDER